MVQAHIDKVVNTDLHKGYVVLLGGIFTLLLLAELLPSRASTSTVRINLVLTAVTNDFHIIDRRHGLREHR